MQITNGNQFLIKAREELSPLLGVSNCENTQLLANTFKPNPPPIQITKNYGVAQAHQITIISLSDRIKRTLNIGAINSYN